jgi:hypothetical protein
MQSDVSIAEASFPIFVIITGIRELRYSLLVWFFSF